jgi:hypothetical protein
MTRATHHRIVHHGLWLDVRPRGEQHRVVGLGLIDVSAFAIPTHHELRASCSLLCFLPGLIDDLSRFLFLWLKLRVRRRDDLLRVQVARACQATFVEGDDFALASDQAVVCVLEEVGLADEVWVLLVVEVDVISAIRIVGGHILHGRTRRQCHLLIIIMVQRDLVLGRPHFFVLVVIILQDPVLRLGDLVEGIRMRLE